MNSFPSSASALPSIRIHDAENDSSALFDGDQAFPADMGFYFDYACTQQPSYFPSDTVFQPASELEDIDIPGLSPLSAATRQPLTGFGYSLPYLQENASADPGLSLSSLGSPTPSPATSFGSSLSPVSMHDALVHSDTEFHLSPTDGQLSIASLIPNDPFPSPPPSPSGTSTQQTSAPSSPRCGPVASKAMLEANGRRRRHPAQFFCEICSQTFTAQFSLKRHVQSHTGQRPFKCSIPGCSQRFYNKSDCKRHEKSKKRHTTA